MNKRVYLKTIGCQMNERDSEEVLGMLMAQGYDIAREPEDAEVILLNTCSVREHAEDRAYGKMWELSVLKRTRPELVLGIIGCMAKLHQESIFKRIPAVDLIAGPAELYDLPYLLAEIQERRQQRQFKVQGSKFKEEKVMAVGRQFRPLELKPANAYRAERVTAFVTIMEGCDKACTYCIVPMTRGQEISRPAEDIIREINELVEAGYQEVVLLGQNVNSYGKRFPDGSGFKGPLGRLRLLQEEPDTLFDFPNLLRLIDRRTHVPRLRFTTSHPFDAHQRLFEAMRDCRSACEWLHLPVQSGSTRILRAMRRGYTREAYLQKIETVRRLMPDVSLSTDIIIGFPGETDEDFEQTESLLRQVEYDNVYIFKYSPRPGTDAAAREDSVAPEVKDARHQRLLALQNEMCLKRHQRWEGRTTEILIEKPGKQPGQLFGRTRGNHGVIIEGSRDLIGRRLSVTIERATAHTLFGELVQGSKFQVQSSTNESTQPTLDFEP